MPLPLLLLPIAVGAAGGGAKVWEGKQAKKAAEAQAKYARELAEARETALRRQAKAEEYRRRQQASATSDEALRRRAAMEARYAKAGVVLSGTPTVALAAQAAHDEQNVQAMNVASFYQQRALRREARNEEMAGIQKAEAYKEAGKQAMREAYVAGATKFVGGFAGVGGAVGTLAAGLGNIGLATESFMKADAGGAGDEEDEGEEKKGGAGAKKPDPMDLAAMGVKGVLDSLPMFLNLLR